MESYSFPDTSIPPAYGPYSHAVVAGDFVFLAGQIARDPVTGYLILSDMEDFDAMNRVYSAAFQAPYPVRSTPQVKMPFGALIGIEVTACRGQDKKALESPQSLDDHGSVAS